MAVWASGDSAAAGSIVSWRANGFTRSSRASSARASRSSIHVDRPSVDTRQAP